MPYRIVRVPGGFKVKSESGTLLSHKPLSLERAKKQKIAATLSSIRREGIRGGSTGGDEGYSLSDTDIQHIMGGGVSLIKYPELEGASKLDDIFDDEGRCIILFLTQDDNTGHWTCVIKQPNHIEYFDPYGGFKPDSERKWLTKAKQEELGQDEPYLTRLLKGYKVVSNPYHFQSECGSVATCGRHVCCRLLHKQMSLPDYKKMIDDSGMTADEFVTKFTSQVIHK